MSLNCGWVCHSTIAISQEKIPVERNLSSISPTFYEQLLRFFLVMCLRQKSFCIQSKSLVELLIGSAVKLGEILKLKVNAVHQSARKVGGGEVVQNSFFP